MGSGLEHLLAQGAISEVIARLKSGKEADVYVVRFGGRVVAAKVYKDRAHRNFKNNSGYKEGRAVRNSRSQRAMDRGSKFGQAAAEEAWKSAEADALYRLHAAGVRVPTPVMFIDGVLLMELVLDGEGDAAPRLIDTQLTEEQANLGYRDMLTQLVRILCCELIHGDLSPYNVLWGFSGPTIIDFPQIISASHNSSSQAYFLRDARNILGFFASVDRSLQSRSSDADEIWRAYASRELTPDFMPTGRMVRARPVFAHTAAPRTPSLPTRHAAPSAPASRPQLPAGGPKPHVAPRSQPPGPIGHSTRSPNRGAPNHRPNPRPGENRSPGQSRGDAAHQAYNSGAQARSPREGSPSAREPARGSANGHGHPIEPDRQARANGQRHAIGQSGPEPLNEQRASNSPNRQDRPNRESHVNSRHGQGHGNGQAHAVGQGHANRHNHNGEGPPNGQSHANGQSQGNGPAHGVVHGHTHGQGAPGPNNRSSRPDAPRPRPPSGGRRQHPAPEVIVRAHRSPLPPQPARDDEGSRPPEDRLGPPRPHQGPHPRRKPG